MLKDIKEAGDKFKCWFVIYVIAVFFIPLVHGMVRPSWFNLEHQVSDINTMNWAKLVLDHIKYRAKKYELRQAVSGWLLLLVVCKQDLLSYSILKLTKLQLNIFFNLDQVFFFKHYNFISDDRIDFFQGHIVDFNFGRLQIPIHFSRKLEVMEFFRGGIIAHVAVSVKTRIHVFKKKL